MKLQEFTSLVLLASTLPLALGWGQLGHETIAYIASNFGEQDHSKYYISFLIDYPIVSSTTTSYFQGILGDTSADYLASIAAYVSIHDLAICLY